MYTYSHRNLRTINTVITKTDFMTLNYTKKNVCIPASVNM